MRAIFAAATAAFLLMPVAYAPASAATDIRTEQVQFPKGASSTVIQGTVQGRGTVDYRVRASAGQTLIVSLESASTTYFNINPPGSDASMFIGSTSGNTFEGILPTDGDYTVRVYLLGNAVHQNESSNYSLTLGVTGKPLVAVSDSIDAVLPGTPFHASTMIPCEPSIGSKVRCEAFVIRRSFDGTATVEVRWPGGMKRRILFVKGKPVASDSRYTLTVSRKGDLSLVKLGTEEQFTIPDLLIFGG
jgi:hypothetical protein